jgi:uncharacterized protein YdhG (YjbR/CyaY superfamily)
MTMTKTSFTSVDHYIAAQPEAVQGVLERVRGIVRKAVPGAQEAISYQIPTYRLHGRPVIYFAGWKEHYSLYPLTKAVAAAFKEKLARYVVSKGTIRFPLDEPVPASLIAGIARVRAKEVAEQAKPTAAGVRRKGATSSRAARRTP